MSKQLILSLYYMVIEYITRMLDLFKIEKISEIWKIIIFRAFSWFNLSYSHFVGEGRRYRHITLLLIHIS